MTEKKFHRESLSEVREMLRGWKKYRNQIKVVGNEYRGYYLDNVLNPYFGFPEDRENSQSKGYYEGHPEMRSFFRWIYKFNPKVVASKKRMLTVSDVEKMGGNYVVKTKGQLRAICERLMFDEGEVKRRVRKLKREIKKLRKEVMNELEKGGSPSLSHVRVLEYRLACATTKGT